MIVKLLTEHHLEFLSLKGGCRGSYESTLVKMSNCLKSHRLAHILSSGFNIQSHSLLLSVFLRYARFCERALLFQWRQFTKSVIKNVICLICTIQ